MSKKIAVDAATITVTLDQLTISDFNVRAASNVDDASLELLTASIASLGLLQPLVVIDGPELSTYEVVAGRRRFLALERIRERGVLNTIAIAVKVVDAAHATEASLAENYARVQMTSPELYGAFKKLADGGMDMADIGRALGYDEKRVARILRLSQLHPAIMKAWANGAIDEEQAQAFATTGDQDVQDQAATTLLERQSSWSSCWAHLIKSTIKRIIEGDGAEPHIVKFVGIESYDAAGGSYEKDLFSDAVMIKDAALLTRLADDKIEVEKAKDEARIERSDGGNKNIEWVEQAPQINRYGYLQNDTDLLVQFEPQPLSEEAQTRQLEIETTLADDEGVEAMDEDQYTALEEELEALLANTADGPLIIPAGKGKVLLVGEISRAGTWDTRAFYADRDAAGLPPLTKSNVSTTSATGKISAGEQAKKDLGASRDGFMAMQVLFADTVAVQLIGDAERGDSLGLDTLLFGLAWNRVKRYTEGLGLPLNKDPERGNHKIRDLVGERATIIEQLPTAGWLALDDTAAAWDAYLVWIGEGANRALLGAVLLDNLWSPLASAYREEVRPKLALLVAETAFGDEGNCAVAEIMPRVAGLKLMSHKARVALLNQWGLGDHAKGLKKDTSVDFAAKVLAADADQRKLWGIDEETDAAIDAWLPSELEVVAVPRPVAKVEKPKATKPKATTKPKKVKELADARP